MDDWRVVVVEVEVEVEEDGRRVSGRPGAEGAPWVGWEEALVLDVLVGWVEEGARRSD